MSDSSNSYHEPIEQLTADTKEMHRALISLREELEAVDWYRQRADACADDALRGILLHNMREEVEHACMLLEWLRRSNADFDENMATYLFAKDTEILAAEEQEAASAAQPDPDGRGKATTGAPPAPTAASTVPVRLTVGSLKEAK